MALFWHSICSQFIAAQILLVVWESISLVLCNIWPQKAFSLWNVDSSLGFMYILQFQHIDRYIPKVWQQKFYFASEPSEEIGIYEYKNHTTTYSKDPNFRYLIW